MNTFFRVWKNSIEAGRILVDIVRGYEIDL